MKNTVESKRPYQHFKGNLYYVHDVLTHSETQEALVSYQALYPPYAMFARPLASFLEDVDPKHPENTTGQKKRFQLFDSSRVLNLSAKDSEGTTKVTKKASGKEEVEIYEFYVELMDSVPLVWRTFQIPSDMSLFQLAIAMHVLFEMDGSHQFMLLEPGDDNQAVKAGKTRKKKSFWSLMSSKNRKIYQLPDPYDDGFGEEHLNPEEVTIGEVLECEQQAIYMLYDFGDDWSFYIHLKEIKKLNKTAKNTKIQALSGEGFGILEDCGGVCGLTDVVKKTGAYYEEFIQNTSNKNTDYTYFDIEFTNKQLKKIK